MNVNDRAKILDKIKKCLRLSKSSNEHEAAAALRQAQKLMQQLGLTNDDVIAAEASDAHAKATTADRPPSWEVMLAKVCCGAFGCEVIFSAGGWTDAWRRAAGSYQFIGCDGRAELCSYAFVVLARQARKARADYIASKLQRCKPKIRTARADHFCRGWVLAVNGLVTDFARTDADRQAVKAWIKTTGIVTQTKEVASRKVRGGHADGMAGIDAGSNVRLDRPIPGQAREALS